MKIIRFWRSCSLLLMLILFSCYLLKNDNGISSRFAVKTEFFQNIWIGHQRDNNMDSYEYEEDSESPLHDQMNEDGGMTCKFPYLDPMEESLRTFIQHPRSFECKKIQEDFSYIDSDENVSINTTLIQSLEKKYRIHIKCFWKGLSKGVGDRNRINETRAHSFRGNKPVQFSDSGILQVKCFRLKTRLKRKKNIYLNVHVLPQPVKMTLHAPSEEQLSVYLFILESMSRARFIRHMKSLGKVIKKDLNSFIFKGYNKIADNTFINLIPLYSGLRANDGQTDMKEEFRKTYRNMKSYDEVDHFLWKQFSRRNYVTAFVESDPHIGTFTYNGRKGFTSSKPFDYYFRPYFLRARKLRKYSSKYCFGNTPYASTQINITQRLFELYGNTQKLFAVNMIVTPGHDEENDIERADNMLAGSFKQLAQSGAFNKTIVIVAGDHGPRFGKVRLTKNGYFEERLTFLSIALPDWFPKKYPDITNNLKSNQARLTTPFDVHQTLIDVLNSSYTNKSSSERSRGISLFDKIPKNRTCALAGIPQFYCSCFSTKSLTVHEELIQKLAHEMVKHINDMLAKRKLDSKCAILELQEVKQASQLFGAGEETNVQRYKIMIRTVPGNAIFESVTVYNTTSQLARVSDGVSRLNIYGKQGKCIQSAFERYCYCKENLSLEEVYKLG